MLFLMNNIEGIDEQILQSGRLLPGGQEGNV